MRLYVTYLRQKLEDDPGQPLLIVTEWGLGYRLVDRGGHQRLLKRQATAVA